MQTSPNYAKKVTFNKFRIYENEWLESGTMLSLVFIFSLPRGIFSHQYKPFLDVRIYRTIYDAKTGRPKPQVSRIIL